MQLNVNSGCSVWHLIDATYDYHCLLLCIELHHSASFKIWGKCFRCQLCGGQGRSGHFLPSSWFFSHQC